MFSADKPISSVKNDKLGRSFFAKQLAKVISDYEAKENYAISIQGKWGCGKTSVINMILEEIVNISTGESRNEIVIVQFNPWNFTDTTQLINQFFITLSNSLKWDDKDKKAKKIGAAIEKYSMALEYSEYIPVIGTYLKTVPKFFSNFGKKMKEKAEARENDIIYRKQVVEDELSKLDKRILVVIDDIDRLSNEQIQLIFKLVNAVAGFPNITYLLSYDKEIVQNALSNIQNCKGEEYLEKIIQVPFDIPMLNRSRLHRILFDRLDEIKEVHSGLEFDKERWSYVFDSCINPFIETLRDVNRFCNSLSFTYSTVKEEVDFIDMAGLTALQIFSPPIYEWIRDNRYSIVGYNAGVKNHNEIAKKEEEMLEKFEKIFPEQPYLMFSAIKCLFPKFAYEVSYSSIVQSASDIHQAMRLASDSKFDLYFSLALENVKISRKEVDDSLFSMNKEELQSYVETLKSRDLLYDYTNEVKHNLARVPEERFELIIGMLVNLNGKSVEENSKQIDTYPVVISVYSLSEMLFTVENEEERYSIISKLFISSDFYTFQFLLHLLHVIELTHGRITDSPYSGNPQLVNLENLIELEKIVMNKIESYLDEVNMFDWVELRRVSFIWEFIDEKTYTDYIISAISNDIYAITLLSLYVAAWSSGRTTSEYEVSNYTYEKYISTDDLLACINRASETLEFWELEQSIIERAAAFSIFFEKNDDNKLISINEVNSKLSDWKRKIDITEQ